jgi:hypothetical protein
MADRSRRRTAWPCLGALALALAAGGCSFGPRALERTHGRYNESVRRVYEEQLLANIVHERYDETPSETDVTAVTAQYELGGTAEARPFFIAPNPSNSNVIFKTFTSILPDLLVTGYNRPTVTLTPAIDDQAVRAFLTPASADDFLFFTQTGGSASTILRLWVERLDGVPNAPPVGSGPCDADPQPERFRRAVELFERVRARELTSIHAEERATEVGGPLPAEAVTAAAAVEAAKSGLEYRPRPDGKTWVLVRRSRRLVLDVSRGAEADPELAELESLLNLQPGRTRYELVVAVGGAPDPLRVPSGPSADLHVWPRSTAQVWAYLANGVEVPAEHLESGAARPAAGGGPVATAGLFEVHVCGGKKPPATAYVAVKYRGYWYYIDDRDGPSKETFALVLQLSRLDFGRRPPTAAPLLTLPAGR